MGTGGIWRNGSYRYWRGQMRIIDNDLRTTTNHKVHINIKSQNPWTWLNEFENEYTLSGHIRSMWHGKFLFFNSSFHVYILCPAYCRQLGPRMMVRIYRDNLFPISHTGYSVHQNSVSIKYFYEESNLSTKVYNYHHANYYESISRVLIWIRTHYFGLNHSGRVTDICVGKTNIIGSDNGLSPGRRQAIISTNAGILLIGTLGTNSSETFNRMSFIFIQKNCIWKCRLENDGRLVSASIC